MNGKIFWVLDDFAYIGAFVPDKKRPTSHTVARIENVIIDDNMIKFYVLPHEAADKIVWSYNVNLLNNPTGTRYEGGFTEATEPDHKGKITCELYSNTNKYLLQGRWYECDEVYTWWAIIEKERHE
jgi:hypothetical protein